MKMTLRWFGEKEDSVKLEQIRQIPGVKGVISALHHIPAGEVWPLDEIIPICEEYKIKMAVHPDDPAWDVFGLPRIVTCEKDMEKIIELNSSIYNGFTLCTGSLGSNKNNDIPSIIKNKKITERIHFAHIRNIKFEDDRVFHESSHLSSDGSLDMFKIVKSLIENGFDGVVRPDHGRMIWDEKARPGYGLYDRALGVAYLNGLWEAIIKIRDEVQQ